jgi:hypothetical protein
MITNEGGVLMKLKIEKQKVSTLEFLEVFKGNGPFNIRILPDLPKEQWTKFNFNKNYSFKDREELKRSLKGELYRTNMHRNGVFFVVNNGMHSDNTIEKVTAQFIDFDHVPFDQQIAKLNEFGLLPSIMIMPTRGLHCYWLMSEAKVSDFRRLQERLIHFFESDKVIVNESRVMRLPGFYHQKAKPKMVDIVWWHPELTYTQEQLNHRLTELGVPEEITKPKKTSLSKKSSSIVNNKITSRIDQTLLNMVENHLGKLKTRDGEQFSCLCPFHDDHRPSGAYFAGNEWFYCHACGQSISLTQMAKELKWQDIIDYMKRRNIQNRRRYEENFQKELAKQLMMIQKHPIYVHNRTKVESLANQRTIHEVTNLFEQTMKKRGFVIDEKLQTTVKQILLLWEVGTNINQPLVWPAQPGSGKSTLMKIYVQYKIKVDSTFGCLIVTERKEDADALAKQLNIGKTTTWSYLGWDVKWCLANKSEYYPGMCQGCPFTECRVLQNMEKQRFHPIAITTHQRFADLTAKGQLGSTFGHWIDEHGNKYARKLLIIDEAPPMLIQNTFNRSEFEQLNKEVEKVLQNSSQLADEWRNFWYKFNEYLVPIPAIRYISRYEMGINLSKRLKQAVSKKINFGVWDSVIDFLVNGGIYCPNTESGWKLTISKKISYNWDGFRPFILDGTGITDLRYSYGEYQFIATPEFSSPPISIHVCNDFGFGKRYMVTHNLDEVIQCHVNVVKSLLDQHKKMLVVVRKDYESQYNNLLQNEVMEKIIAVDHFGNLKGKNDYQDCDAIIFFGVLDKGDDHYAASMLLNHEDPYSVCLEGKEYLNIHRFEDIQLESFKLNEIGLELVQDIFRTRVRCNKPVDVYLFSRDKVLMEHLGRLLGGINIDSTWKPIEVIPLTKPGENVIAVLKALKDFIQSGAQTITKEEIKYCAGLHNKNDKVWRRVWNNPYIKAFCRESGIVEPNKNSRILLREIKNDVVLLRNA